MTRRRRQHRWLAIGALFLAGCGGADLNGEESATESEALFPETTMLVSPASSSTAVDETVAPAPSVVSTTTSTSTVVALSTPSCASNDLPPAGNALALVMVKDITAVDSDKGLNIRTGPSTSDPVQFALPNGSTMTATGPCEVDAGGQVWWEVENGYWSGWASSTYLTSFNSSATTACPVANFNPIGKGTVEKILGDFDGNGSVDAVFLSYDGVVNPPFAWTGTKATIQIQYADGGLSYELDITPVLSDGGPSLGVLQMPGFPDRVDPANTTRSVAVISSHYDTSATGAGQVHVIGELNCSPTVIANLAMTPSAGNPERPILCDIGGGGRTQLWALEGLDANGDYLATELDFQGTSYVPQGQQVLSSQGLSISAEDAIC